MRITLIAFVAALLASDTMAADKEDPAILATGKWSEPVGDTVGYQIRGRLVVAKGHTLGDTGFRETVIYLELQNFKEAISEAINVYVDAGQVRCELHDKDGNLIESAPTAFGGFMPRDSWVSLPHDSTIRLRVSAYNVGSEGLTILLSSGQGWTIKLGETASLSGTFKSDPPKSEESEPRKHIWHGELKLPAAEISLK